MDDIEKWRKSVEADYLTMTRAPRDRLRWTTLILAVRVVRLGDDPSDEVISIIEQLPDELRACAMQSGFLKRGTRWAGVVEIDLVHPRLLGGAAKRDLIGVLAGIDPNTLTADQRLIVVHLHAVVDSKGHTRPAKFADDMRKCWPGPRRVHSASIWTEGTVAENLTRLASYSTKLWNHYCEAWEGRPTRRLMAREPEWTAWMRRLHDAIGLPNMVVSSVSSRAAQCPRDHVETLVPQGFDENPGGSQLMAPANDQDNPQEPLIKTLMKAIMAKENNALPPSEDLPQSPTTAVDPSSRGHEAQDAGGHSRTRTGDRAPGAADPADGAGPADRGKAGQAAHSRTVDEEGGCGSRAAAEDQGHPGISEQADHRHQGQDRLTLRFTTGKITDHLQGGEGIRGSYPL
jgi:hypothetical protein